MVEREGGGVDDVKYWFYGIYRCCEISDVYDREGR